MVRSQAFALIASGSLLLLGPAARGGIGIPPLTTVHVAGDFTRPVFVTSPPGDSTRLFVVELRGTDGVADRGAIKIINLPSGTVNPTPFLVINGLTSGPEQGLLGLAFHPNYATNGFFYVNFTTTGGGPGGRTIVRRYRVSTTNPNVADPASGLQIISYNQPYAEHKAGWMGFGPAGDLYIASGDGGGAFDPDNRAQDITNEKLGKVLRVNVDSDAFPGDPTRNYTNPVTNPFAVGTGDDEIWAYGLRNPWRCSFDRQTGALWIGDVGQADVDEINFQAANPAGAGPGMPGYQGGKDYGWRCMEGLKCTGLSGCICGSPALTNPVYTDDHTGGTAAIVGGYVYRGCAMPALHGTYFFAEFVSGRLMTFTLSGGVVTNFANRTAELAPPKPYSIAGVTSFGEDACGELYICTYSGAIFKIVPSGIPTNPADLNSDGVVNGVDLAILLAAWGRCPAGGACGADISHDGLVNGLDLAMMLAAWG